MKTKQTVKMKNSLHVNKISLLFIIAGYVCDHPSGLVAPAGYNDSGKFKK